jgi:DNA-binding transcriptional LysR family regulator
MIDPNHLRTLRALADHGTVVAAAETLHLSPSAVSQQLNSLARTTGCTLLEKRGRGVVLTQPAKILLEHADAILERFEQAESDMRSYQQGDAAVLRIGGFSSALQSFVSEAVSTALHRNPGWSIQIDEVESEESMAMLLDRELDVSVVMIAPNRPLLADRRISLDPLLADTYRAVVPAVHPLGALDELDRLSRLAYEPWVLSRHWTSTHEIVMAACAVAGFQPRAAHNTTDFAASVAMVGHGLGVSVIPMLGLPRIVPDSVKILPIRVDPPTRHIAVAVRSGSAQPGSPLAQFRALLKQMVAHLVEPTTVAAAVTSAIEAAERSHAPVRVNAVAADVSSAVDEVAVDGAAVEDAGVEDVAVEEAAVEGAVVEDVAVEGAVVEYAVVEDVAVEGAAVEYAGVEGVAVEGAGVEDAAVEDVVFGGAGVEDAVVEDAAVADVVVEDAAIEDAVVVEAASQG